MHLNHLSLTNFRNFTRLDIDVPRGTVVLVGSNAQGKTSLLEAAYMLATLTSFHADSDRQLINFFTAQEAIAVARIVADFQRGDKNHRLEVRIIQERDRITRTPRVRKEVLLDGLKHKVREAVGHFNAVLFLPQMLRVVDGSPEDRRRYLNLALSQVMPDYTATLSEYSRILTQRNALLRQLNDYGGDPDQMIYWDEQLTILGAKLIHARIQAVQELDILAALTHRDLTRGDEVLRLDYRPAYDPLPSPDRQFTLALEDPRDRSGFTLEQIQQGFADALAQSRAEEIARGVTTVGPHRDELRFLSNGVDLGTFGSRGQARTTLITLKLVEVAWMKEKSGHWPVLLLDEVLAELDINRRADLQERVALSEQVLLTTTDLNLFSPKFAQASQKWKIDAGRVRAY